MKKMYPYLTYAGTLPFITCALCLVLNIETLPVFGSIEKILSIYSLVITNFIAGSLWGQHLHIKGKWSCYLPILSNIFAVILWLLFIVLPFKPLIIIFVAAFIVLLLIDHRLLQHNFITQDYFRTRCFVSAIVIVMLIISWIFR